MQVVSQSVTTKPATLVVVRDYRTCAMYGCIVRFTNCASTNACRQGENSISRTSRELLACPLQPLHVRLQLCMASGNSGERRSEDQGE
jgi:hypothetical protein